MVPYLMAHRPTLGRAVAFAAVVAVVAAAGSACGEATLSEQGSVRPVSLVFSVQPEYATAGYPLQPGVAVTVMESNGDTAYESNATIQLSIAIGTGNPAAQLRGVTAVAAVYGTAIFPTVNIDSADSGYRLRAVAPGLGGAVSNAFRVTAGSPVRLAFVRQPTGAAAGDTISPAVRVAVQDMLGNTVLLATDSISLAIGANPGPGSLDGTLVQPADSGVATFADLSISAPGVGYTLQATASGRSPAASEPFTITAAVAARTHGRAGPWWPLPAAAGRAILRALPHP
jgi:hypothetical protein